MVRIKKVLTYITLVVILIVFFIPIYWTIITSLKPESKVYSEPLDWGILTLSNWEKILIKENYTHFFLNSCIISLSATFLGLLIGVPMAYSLTRLKVRRSKDILFWVLSLRILPIVTIGVPLFIIYTKLRWINTYRGAILAHTLITLPYIVWIMRSFLVEIPKEIDEAALVDGCSNISVLTRIILPMVIPALVVCSLFAFLFSWNDYLLTFLLTERDTNTLPVAIAALQTKRIVLWGQLTAAGTLSLAPALAFAFLARKYLTRGLSFGLIKG